jgi:hypothetical protein
MELQFTIHEDQLFITNGVATVEVERLRRGMVRG